ncbi:MAG: hypothetical protein LUF28_11410 [Clostridiales bacterium]|nr:hypothetical protein [Clostridiales bacterium]
METVYFTTRSFIRHEDNVIDFEEYKEKLAAQQALLAEPEEPEAALPRREAGPSAAPDQRTAVVRLKDALDLAASAAMLLVAVITAVIIL